MKKVLIIGLGLLGASIAKDLKKKKLYQVLGYSRNPHTIDYAFNHKIIDQKVTIETGIKKAELIIIATPVSVMKDYFKLIELHAKKNTLVMDVGSTKEEIIKSAKKIFSANVHFIGVHPMAGLESTGVESSVEGLFKDRACLLTPLTQDLKAINLAKKFWVNLGSKVFIIPAKKHDHYLAYSSHLPQMISYLLFSVIIKKIDQKILPSVTGNGFKDMTRLASSSVEMWMAIITQNQKNILLALKSFKKLLDQMIDDLEKSEFKKLEKLLEKIQKSKKL